MSVVLKIQLKELKEEDIELVRVWRNKSYVRQQLFSQGEISEHDQKRWFAGLDSSQEKYFIAQDGDTKFGLFYLKKINLHSAETGAFVGEEQYLSTHAPIIAAFLLISYSFENLKLNYLNACHFKTNKKAERSDQFLGYSVTKEENGVVYGKLTRDDFEQKKHRIIKIFEAIK